MLGSDFSADDELREVFQRLFLRGDWRVFQGIERATDGLTRLLHRLLNGPRKTYRIDKTLYAGCIFPATLRQREHILVARVGFGKIDRRQGHEYVQQMGSNRFANGGLVTGEIENVIHDLEGH